MEALLLPFVAVVAGVVSFSSPCCVPLVPSYLSYVSTLPVSELGRREARAVTVRAALLFVAGFSLVFTTLGVSVALMGNALQRNLPLIIRVSGIAIIGMGVASLGVVRVPWLYRERRIDMARVPAGPRSGLLLGATFGFGWVPCIGPVLATILATAAATQTAAWGGLLLALYSVGLGLPFVALAVGFQHGRGSLEWLRRHGRAVEAVGGVLLIGVGSLFVSGAWRSFFIPLQRRFAEFGWPPI